jgi:hypothetical protein
VQELLLAVYKKCKHQQDRGYQQDNSNVRSQGSYYFEPFTHYDLMLPLKLLPARLKIRRID